MRKKQKPHKHPEGNLLLMHGLLIAPIAVFCDTLRHGLMLAFAFSILTVVTVLLSFIIPHRVPHFLRIILYSVIAGLVYIPTAMLTVAVFHEAGFGIYLPLLAGGLSLTAAHDRIFPRKGKLKALFFQLFGTAFVMLLLSAVREFLGAGTIWGISVLLRPPLPFLLTPAAGLITVVFLAVWYTALKQDGQKEETDAVHD